MATLSEEELIGGAFKSINIDQLEELMEMYAKKRNEDTGQLIFSGGIKSNDLAMHFKKNKIWPPLYHSDKFSVNPPDVVVTYMWNGTLVSDIPKLIKARLSKMGRNKFTVWIDVWFNDQRNPEKLRDAVNCMEFSLMSGGM